MIRFYSLWAINGPLNQSRLRRQMDQLRAAGFDGVVFHPRFYPNEPPYLGDDYLRQVSDAILHAKSIGLAFWIYDEDGWPSGTVGGQLLKKFPQDAQRWAELVTEKPERCLAEFEQDGKKWFVAERTGTGVDYFNPDLARHFIGLTHERYRTGLAPEAWEHVGAIFCDEPEFGLGHAYDSLSKHGAIPWTPKLPELFRAKHGEDLLPLLPHIFFGDAGRARHSVRAVRETESAPGGSRRAEDSDESRAGCPSCQATRVKFWELLTDIFNESFTTPINNWCARHGKLFTAHVKGEEHPLFQVPTSGSCHQFFRNLSLPGIDALERYPSNNFYPRQVSSAARQFGDGRCMVEAFGGAGWGATPEDLERYLLWLGCHGLTDFVLHLSQYRLDSAAMHDWPPSQPLHLTWSRLYADLLTSVRRQLEARPRPAADTLVVAPYRGIMGDYEPWELLKTNVHNAATYPDTAAGKINRHFMGQIEKLHAAGVNYDVADERTVEQFGKFTEGRLVLGKCRYRRVIVNEGCRLDESARSLVQPLVSNGESFNTKSSVETVLSGQATTLAVQWKLEKHPINCLLLECVPEADDWFSVRFDCSISLPDAALELVFADDIAEAILNGAPLTLTQTDEGSISQIGLFPVQSANQLRFLPRKQAERPFVWLRGRFRAMSGTPFTGGPQETIKTDGPFVLHPARETIQRDLITDGFAFLRNPLFLVATVELPDDVISLRLNGVEADALRLVVDDRDCGWVWPADRGFQLGTKLSAGPHHLRLELVPNTFNSFGPHHYCGGDWFVVSPGQVRGVRNFADPADAPARTHVPAWHFRRFQLPASISFDSRAGLQ